MNRLLVAILGIAAIALAVWLFAQGDPPADPPDTRPTGQPSTPEGSTPAGSATPATLVGTARSVPDETSEPDRDRDLVVEVHDGSSPVAGAIVHTTTDLGKGIFKRDVLGTTDRSGIARVRLRRDRGQLRVTATGFLDAQPAVFRTAPRLRVRMWRAPRTMVVIVTGADGQAISNAQVAVTSSEVSLFTTRLTGPDGTATLPLPAFGTFHLTTRAAGWMSTRRGVFAEDIRTGEPINVSLARIPLVQSSVVEATSRTPVSGAQVTDGFETTTTDERGAFTFRSTREWLRVSASGYYPRDHKIRNPTAPVLIVRRVDSPGLPAARPTPSGTFRGTVLHGDGTPASDTRVTGSARATKTDAAGRFTFAADYMSQIIVHQDGWWLLAAGQLAPVTDIRLPPTSSFKAQVHFPDGVAPHRVVVSLKYRSGPEVRAATSALGTTTSQQSSSNGRDRYVDVPRVRVGVFLLGPFASDENGVIEVKDIPVATYTLGVRPNPDSTLLPVSDQPVDVRSESQVLDVHLQRGQTVTVRVEDHRGRPIQGAAVGFDGDRLPNYTNAAGEAMFEGVPPGDLHVRVRSEFGELTKRFSGTKVVVQYPPRPTLEITLDRRTMPDGAGCVVELSVVGARGVQRLKGRVRDGIVRARLPDLDLSRSYEVGIKDKAHWSPWAALDVAADGMSATATVKLYLDEEEDEED